MLGLRNGQPLFRKETIIMLIIGSAGKLSPLSFVDLSLASKETVALTLG